MKILKEATNQMAYLKAGIFGFQGSGKTFTATQIAIGFCKQHRIDKPIGFMDTETGSDFMIPVIVRAGLKKPVVAKTRAFVDLIEVIKEAEANCGFLIIDSITHVWRELCESYQKRLNRKRLQFQDWGIIKGEWGRYTDLFVNSQLHIIACGRAGYEYDYDMNEDGSKDLIKTGTKMKAESEFGFEPSLVIEMERVSEQREEVEALSKEQKKTHKTRIGSKWIHRAHVLKDRTDTIDGASFDDPTYKDLKPHFDNLIIGGTQIGVDTTKTSQELFDPETGDTEWKKRKQQKEIALEEIQAEIVKHIPGQGNDDKKFKVCLLEHVFGSPSWTKIESMDYGTLDIGLKELRKILPKYAGEKDFSLFIDKINNPTEAAA